jgi:putative endonuclease
MNWCVYIVRCSDNSLYTGIATDVLRRVSEHQEQGPRSAKYVRGRTPLQLVYVRSFRSRSAAMREEWRIKHLSKQDKERLVHGEL